MKKQTKENFRKYILFERPRKQYVLSKSGVERIVTSIQIIVGTMDTCLGWG